MSVLKPLSGLERDLEGNLETFFVQDYPSYELVFGVQDPSEVFNTNLRDVLEIGNMLELAQTVAAGALNRRESRGSHARVEHPTRDDAIFLKHTLAYRTEGLPRLSSIPVARTRWEPMERKY